jgi:hypothetical protein
VGTAVVAFVVIVTVALFGRGWFGDSDHGESGGEDLPLQIELFASVDEEVVDLSDLPAVVLDGRDAEALGVGSRIRGEIREGLARWTIVTDLETSEDVEYCFVADVRFEGLEEIALDAGTCAREAATFHLVLPS